MTLLNVLFDAFVFHVPDIIMYPAADYFAEKDVWEDAAALQTFERILFLRSICLARAQDISPNSFALDPGSSYN